MQFFSRKQIAIDENSSSSIEPILFPSLINYIRKTFPDYTNDMFEAYLYAAIIILMTTLNVLRIHSMHLAQMHLGMKLRIALGSLIYRKSLRLSKTALSETTVGQIVNLLSNDIGRFVNTNITIFIFFNFINTYVILQVNM